MASCSHLAQTRPSLTTPNILTSAISEVDRSTGLRNEMLSIFSSMRSLSTSLCPINHSVTTTPLLTFSSQRSALEHRLLALQIRKPPAQMQQIDYLLEARRLAASIYLKCVLQNFKPRCPILTNLKGQLMLLLTEGENKLFFDNVDDHLQRTPLMWVLFMGGILTLDEKEELWFAKRIVSVSQGEYMTQRSRNWTYMECCLRQMSWVDSLRTKECVSLWNAVERLRGQAKT